MTLPTDLSALVFSYIPLKKIQLLNQNGLVVLNNINFLKYLLFIKYNFNINITNTNLLTNFDQFCKYAMLSGDIGYDGQWYLPIIVCLAYCIKNRDKDLLNYYINRFININKFDLTQLALKQYSYYTPIILTLTKEYDTSMISTVTPPTNSDEVRPDKTNTTIVNIMSSQSRFNPQIITQLPNVYSGIMVREIFENGGLITKDYINSARIAQQYVLQHYPQSQVRDQYLDTLAVLLNQDINLQPYIGPRALYMSNFLTKVDRGIVTLAFAVLNSKIINKILNPNLSLITSDTISNDTGIVSEVVYDIDMDIIYKIKNIYLYNSVILSIYLADRAIEINTNLPLVDIYNTIKNCPYLSATPEALAMGAYILDAETAIKLSNNSNYLYPITQFSYDLMVQLGFTPPHKQLE